MVSQNLAAAPAQNRAHTLAGVPLSGDQFEKLVAFVAFTDMSTADTDWDKMAGDLGFPNPTYAKDVITRNPCFRRGFTAADMVYLTIFEIDIIYRYALHTKRRKQANKTDWEGYKKHFGYKSVESARSSFWGFSKTMKVFELEED